jgi:hypothetical protein
MLANRISVENIMIDIIYIIEKYSSLCLSVTIILISSANNAYIVKVVTNINTGMDSKNSSILCVNFEDLI